MTLTLLRGGRIHTAADPDATALAITDGMISWIGGEHALLAAGEPDRVVDLGGALVVPGFVDAHVHSTDAGLVLTGMDLSTARSGQDCLRLLAEAAGRQEGGVLWGHGWDETGWPDQRIPSRAEIDAVVGNRPVYLARVDVHSALVSTALLETSGATGHAGYSVDGPLTMAAYHRVRNAAKDLLGGAQRRQAQAAFLDHALRQGIVQVHECAQGDPAGLADVADLRQVVSPVQVLVYLAALVDDPQAARELMATTEAHGLGGDLSVDGALGSRTAALSHPYEHQTDCGARYLTDDQIADHLWACAAAGVQPGFHAIGDDAVSAVAAGMRRAAERLGGTVSLAAVTPRVEHAEMAGPAAIAELAAVGAVASMQPLFDAAWGGPDGMYAARLGAGRWGPMNNFAALAAAGIALAFGSDAPVTPADPWRAVRAAVHHRTPGSGISPRAALNAHTRGGHRAAGHADRAAGTITVGAPAHLAIVQAGELVRPEADSRVARWSTDPRSRVPLLPDLSPGTALPTTLATLIDGRIAYDTGLFAG